MLDDFLEGATCDRLGHSTVGCFFEPAKINVFMGFANKPGLARIGLKHNAVFNQVHGECGVKIAVGLLPVTLVGGDEVAKVDAEHSVGTREPMFDAVFAEHSGEHGLDVDAGLFNRGISI